MPSLAFNIARRGTAPNASLTGLGGVAHKTGDVVTGEAALRALVLDNGIARYTYERPTVTTNPLLQAEPAAGHLYVKANEAWLRCSTLYYGDWSFFAAPITTTCDRVEVVMATEDAVEVAFVWSDHRLDVAYLGGNGVLWRDSANVPFYDQWNGTTQPFRWLKGIKLTKSVRLERGRAGAFIGWHSDPHVGPPPKRLTIGAIDNQDQAWAERELGFAGSAVLWSSASAAHVGHFPAWSLQRAVWATAEAQNGSAYTERHWWSGIHDPLYGAMATPAFAQTQCAGFPNVQTVGPWYVAGIPGSDTDVGAVCRYTVHQNPIESGGWQFMPTPGRASSVAHTCNNWPGPDGRVRRFQIFNGAFPYIADATAVTRAGYTGTVEYGNEPTASLRSRVGDIAAALTWPTS